MSKPSIGIITIWMGALPDYFMLWISSVVQNPGVNWIFLSDQKCIDNIPSNMQWHVLDMNDLNNIVKNNLDKNLNVSNSYKMCDYRPTFGVLFSKWVSKFDWWGHCDIDVVWGDIRAIATEEALCTADVLSFSGPGWISGPLSLFRTQSAATDLFRSINGWKNLLASKEYVGMDEASCVYDRSRYVSQHPVMHVRSMTDAVHNARLEGRLDVRMIDFGLAEHGGNRSKFSIHYKDGHIKCDKTEKEYAGFHFLFIKNRCNVRTSLYPVPDEFWITRRGVTRRPFGPARAVERAGQMLAAMPCSAKRGARKIERWARQLALPWARLKS